jgi:hypothetical protein
MSISWKRSYIKSNPRFALTRPSRPTLHAGEMTIVYECLEQSPAGASLEELVDRCTLRGYKERFGDRPTDIRKSILYQLKRLLNGTTLVPKDTIRALWDSKSGRA